MFEAKEQKPEILKRTSMEESLSSRKTLSRKRKVYSVSAHFNGILTRNKSQIYVHQNRSGKARSDIFSRRRTSFRSKPEPAQTLFEVTRQNSSRRSLVKDLRRQRIFTLDVNLIGEEEKKDESLNEGNEMLKDSGNLGLYDLEMDKSQVKEEDEKENEGNELLNGAESPGLDSDLGLLDLEVVESKKTEEKSILKDSDTSPDAARVFDSDPNVHDLDVDGSKKIDEPSNLKLKDGTISGNESISKTKMNVSSCKRRKVFINASSFSYRRLLPYLINSIDDDSSVSKFEIVDIRNSKLFSEQKSEAHSLTENGSTSKIEHAVFQSHHINDEKQKLYERSSSNQKNFNGGENELDQKTENISQLEVENGSQGEAGTRINSLIGEECGEKTPPYSDIFSKMGDKSTRETMEADGSSISSKRSNFSSLKVSKFRTKLSNRLLLSPCRLRLFKNPNSVSYRRLLPFFINTPKNNPGDSRTILHQKPMLDLQEDVHPLSVSSSEQNNMNKIITKTSNEKHYTGDEVDDLLSPVFPPTDNSSPGPNINPGSSIPIDLQIIPPKLEPELPNKELAKLHKIGKSIEKINFNKRSSQVEGSNPLVTPVNGLPPKGILKRNPRGCRGPCNCLNCASFRLHADRAFEFSRNQMRDTEEIALKLIKELASLRHMLGKTVVNENDDLAPIQLNLDQVRQACVKALETENLAKARLSQLNYELNIHCRFPNLLQPGVSFANYVQEKAIPRLKPRSKQG